MGRAEQGRRKPERAEQLDDRSVFDLHMMSVFLLLGNLRTPLLAAAPELELTEYPNAATDVYTIPQETRHSSWTLCLASVLECPLVV
jgi:hypothetical protein